MSPKKNPVAKARPRVTRAKRLLEPNVRRALAEDLAIFPTEMAPLAMGLLLRAIWGRESGEFADYTCWNIWEELGGNALGDLHYTVEGQRESTLFCRSLKTALRAVIGEALQKREREPWIGFATRGLGSHHAAVALLLGAGTFIKDRREVPVFPLALQTRPRAESLLTEWFAEISGYGPLWQEPALLERADPCYGTTDVLEVKVKPSPALWGLLRAGGCLPAGSNSKEEGGKNAAESPTELLGSPPPPPDIEPGPCNRREAVPAVPKATEAPCERMTDLVLSEDVTDRLGELVEEMRDASQNGYYHVLLFHGPPGTGKTHAARALAGTLGLPLLSPISSGLLSRYVGDSEKQMLGVFEEAAKQKAVLFLDEVDSLLFKRDDELSTWRITLVNSILQCLDRRAAPVFMATNFRESLDPALARRITEIVEFPLPDERARRILWKKTLASEGFRLKDRLDDLAALELSPALIVDAVRRVRRAKDRGRVPASRIGERLMEEANRQVDKMGHNGLKGLARPIGFLRDPDEV